MRHVLLLISILLFTHLGFAKSPTACAKGLRSAALELISKASQNGWHRVYDVTLNKLHHDIQSEKVPLVCYKGLRIIMGGRTGAQWQQHKKGEVLNHITNNGIVKEVVAEDRYAVLVNQEMLDYPDDIKGALVAHEILGALYGVDRDYEYTAPLLFMAEHQFSDYMMHALFQNTIQLAGGSSGVGGGGPEINLKKVMLEDLVAYLISEKKGGILTKRDHQIIEEVLKTHIVVFYNNLTESEPKPIFGKENGYIEVGLQYVLKNSTTRLTALALYMAERKVVEADQ